MCASGLRSLGTIILQCPKVDAEAFQLTKVEVEIFQSIETYQSIFCFHERINGVKEKELSECVHRRIQTLKFYKCNLIKRM